MHAVRLDRQLLWSRAQVVAALAVGLAVLFAYAWPGYVSPDTIQQYEQARSHHYTDWHPPGMAALWTVVRIFVKGGSGMLVLQGITFVVGAFLILRRAMSDRAAAIVTSLVLVFPPVLTTMACIWKDCQMAGFLMLGIGLIVSKQRWQMILGAVLMIFATAMRHNAAAATLPALVLLFQWKHGHVWWKRVGLACAVWALTVVATLAINQALTKQEEHAWHVSIAPADIIGTIKYSRDYSDAELLVVLDGVPLSNKQGIQAHMRYIYNPYLWFFYAVPGPRQVFNWPQTEAERQAITRAWKRVIRDNPRAYINHRMRVFRGVLGLTHGLPLIGAVYSAHYDLEAPNAEYQQASGVQGVMADAFLWLADHTALFRPYPVFFLAIVLLYFARRNPLALALLVSGLMYELPLFFIAPSGDNRYSHWMLATTLLALAVLVASRVARRTTVVGSSSSIAGNSGSQR